MTTPNTHVPSGHFSVDELLEDLKSFGQSVVDGIGEIADTVGGAISDFGDGLFGVEKEIYLSPLQTSAGAIEAINEGTSLIRAGANAAIFGERTQNKLPSIEAETVKEKNDEIINIFPDWFVDLADLKFEADNLNESSKRMCWDSMVDILTRKGGENLIKVVSGTVIIGGLSVANLPIGLATLGISFVVAGVNAWSAGKNEEDIADAMIDGYFDAAVFMGTSYVTGKGVAALVKKFGITTSLGTLSIESGVETLIEEITYTIQSGSVNILGALLNFFTNIGFNKIAEVPQKLLHSIGEALEKWGKKALKDLDDWFKSFDGGTGTQGVGNPVEVAGRGSTGRTIPNTLNEQMAMQQVMSNPLEGATKLPFEMSDPRWPASEGWVKMQVVIKNADKTQTTIHYVYNEITGAFDDFKFK